LEKKITKPTSPTCRLIRIEQPGQRQHVILLRCLTVFTDYCSFEISMAERC